MTPRIVHHQILFLAAGIFSTITAWSQITIRSNTTMHARGLITTNTSIANPGSNPNLDEAQLTLAGSTQKLTTTTPLKVTDLVIAQGGTKTLIGNWEVSGTLTLSNGIVRIDSDGKLLYSGTGRVEGNNGAFIDGGFYQNSGGQRFFPIGNRGIYAPAIIENAPASEIGMRVLPSASEIPLTLPPDVIAAYRDRYWEIDGPVSSIVSLSTNSAESFLEAAIPTVLQAEATGGNLTALSATYSEGFVTSVGNASQPLLFIGKTAEFKLVIHDLITPYNINVNDRLVIENLDKVEHNDVKLLDRWGVVVAQWKDYNDNVEYDFTKLSPGNYVCLVQFNYPGETRTSTVKGMVTVIKSN